MLTPQELLQIVDTMQPLLDELNGWITSDIISRLMARLGRGEGFLLTGTDEWQMEVYQSAGGHYDALQKKIQDFTKKSEAEVKAIFEDAGIRAWEADNAFYVSKGLESISLVQSERMVQILTDTYQRTNGEIRNFTRTTAAASQQRFIQVLDDAHFKVITGAQGYTQAVLDAVQEVSSTQTKVQYPSGHTDTIETAVLRAVRTGVAQASGNMSIQGMVEHEWDLIRVSAHLGARYGDGGENPGNHFWWQGKLYSRTGQSTKYPDFVKSTGYGTGEGLCGWNCRHSFGPGDEDYNPYSDFDTEENKKAYDLSQKQRAMERRIRHQKTKLLGLRQAMDSAQDATLQTALQNEYDNEAVKLGRYNAQYNRFCEANDLKRLSDRISVAKWTRSEAGRAAQSAKAYYQKWVKEIGASDAAPKTLADYYQNKYNDTWEHQLLMGYNKAVQSGDISPLVGFQHYIETAQKANAELIGLTTKNGYTVEAYTTHFIDRVIGQVSTPHKGKRLAVPIENVLDCLRNPKEISNTYERMLVRSGNKFADQRIRFFGEDCVVTFSIRENSIIQVNPNRKG